MAKRYIDAKTSLTDTELAAQQVSKATGTGTPYLNPFDRKQAFPIDRSELFDTVDDAKLYASGGSDSRSLSGTAWVGQEVAIVEYKDANTTKVERAVITSSGTLDSIVTTNTAWETYVEEGPEVEDTEFEKPEVEIPDLENSEVEGPEFENTEGENTEGENSEGNAITHR